MMRRNNGFTLTGLIITILIMTTLSSITTPLLINSLRRQRLNNLVIELSGWLEEVSVRSELAGSPCEVTITTGNLAPGNEIARVTPAACATQIGGNVTVDENMADFSSFSIPSFFSIKAQTYNVQIDGSEEEGKYSWFYTPRATISDSSNIEIRINLNGKVPVRCIQLSSFLGHLRQGSNNAAASADDSCNNYNSL